MSAFNPRPKTVIDGVEIQLRMTDVLACEDFGYHAPFIRKTSVESQ